MRVILLLLVSMLFSSKVVLAAEANELFQNYQSALVQIKSINAESGQKSSIGTGFFINDSGQIVTNYHVIADVIQSPEQYHLEFLDHKEVSHPVEVLDIDVINDLAVLSSDYPSVVYFDLAQQAPEKGAELFALGNPHDLGMIVVPGTYNGIKQKSFYKRIHFTGSINPGMSGGPTVDRGGQVVGINVATAGNQIGFLVPVKQLHTLLKQASVMAENSDENRFIDRISQQLKDNQQSLFAQLLDAPWPSDTVGKARIPKEITKFMPCWGDSNKDKEKIRFTKASISCSLEDNIFLSGSMRSGYASVSFNWLQSNKLNDLQLNQLYTNQLNQSFYRSNAGADDVTNFHCEQANVVNSAGSVSKNINCVRAYRKYPGLFDVRFVSVLLGVDKQALLSRYSLQGVSQDMAQRFYQKFVEQVSWN